MFILFDYSYSKVNQAYYVSSGQSATFLEVDHEAHRVYVEEIQMIPLDQGLEVMRPSDDTIASRLSAPIVSFDIDTKKISFERYSLKSYE